MSVRRVASRAVSLIDGFAPELVDDEGKGKERKGWKERNNSSAPPKKAIRRPAKEHATHPAPLLLLLLELRCNRVSDVDSSSSSPSHLLIYSKKRAAAAAATGMFLCVPLASSRKRERQISKPVVGPIPSAGTSRPDRFLSLSRLARRSLALIS